jgi:hypothetical protein
MIRLAAIVLAGVLVCAAGSSPPTPRAHVPTRLVGRAARLPLPPAPPAHASAGVVVRTARSSFPLPPLPPTHAPAGEAAPLPDDDLSRPTPGTETATFHVRMFSLDEHDSGLAFIPGSAYPAPEDRKPMQTPGVTVSVPMQ